MQLKMKSATTPPKKQKSLKKIAKTFLLLKEVETTDKEKEKIAELLFYKLDQNKNLRLNATSEEQIQQLDRIDNEIIEELKKLYVQYEDNTHS